MNIVSAKFETISEQYKEALLWLEKIGIKIDNNRINSYSKFLDNLLHQYKNGNDDALDKLFPGSVNTFYEVNAITSIYESLRKIGNKDIEGIKVKLEKTVCGPEAVTDETDKSNAARNYLFEVLVSSRMHNPSKGVFVDFTSKTDSAVNFLQKSYLIECKRIQSKDQISKNVRRAAKQLEKSLRTKIGSNNRGIIALDVSKIINPGFELFVRKNERSLQLEFNALVDSFIQSHSHIWQNILKEKNRKIVGVILRVSLMGISKDRNLLVTMVQWAMNPKLTNKNFESSHLQELVNTIDFKQRLAFT
jgi:hypothetical protein